MEIRSRTAITPQKEEKPKITNIRQIEQWGDFRDELLRHFMDFLDQGEGATGYHIENYPYLRYAVAWVFGEETTAKEPKEKKDKEEEPLSDEDVYLKELERLKNE